MTDSSENMDQQDVAAADAPDAAAGDAAAGNRHDLASRSRSPQQSARAVLPRACSEGSGSASSDSDSQIPSLRSSSRISSNVASDITENGSQVSDTKTWVLLRLRHPSGEGVYQAPGSAPIDIRCDMDATMGQIQNRIAASLRIPNDVFKIWFINRRLVVGLDLYDFEDPYFKFMTVMKQKGNLSLSLDRESLILETTLLVLPTTDPRYVFVPVRRRSVVR